MDLLPRLALWAGVRLMPGLTVTGRGLEIKPSDNIAMLRALSRDPLVIKETRVDTIYGLVDLMDAALDSAPLLDVPLLVMYGAKDEIVPKTPIRRFVGSLPPECRHRAKLAWYKDGYHMLLRDLEGPIVTDRCRKLGAHTRRAAALGRRSRRSGSFLARRQPSLAGRTLTDAPGRRPAIADLADAGQRHAGDRQESARRPLFLSARRQSHICRRATGIRPLEDDTRRSCWLSW